MNPSARRHAVSVIAFSALAAFGAVTLCPRVSVAQDLTSIALSSRAVVAGAHIDPPSNDRTNASSSEVADHGRVSPVMQSLYVTTVTVQGLDAQSTFKALGAGGAESNSLVKPIVSNHPAFVALKLTMATAFIYAGHDLSTRHKIGAIIALTVVNSVYTAMAINNYRVAHVMDIRR